MSIIEIIDYRVDLVIRKGAVHCMGSFCVGCNGEFNTYVFHQFVLSELTLQSVHALDGGSKFFSITIKKKQKIDQMVRTLSSKQRRA